jgi:hypothetical protein
MAPIHILHTSFSEFMLDHSRSRELACESGHFNLNIAKRGLALMDSQLHPNLCKLTGSPQNVLICPDVIQTHVSPALRYTATYLVDHWMLSDRSELHLILTSIRNFLTRHLLCWFECLSLIGKLVIGIRSLKKISKEFTQVIHSYF